MCHVLTAYQQHFREAYLTNTIKFRCYNGAGYGCCSQGSVEPSTVGGNGSRLGESLWKQPTSSFGRGSNELPHYYWAEQTATCLKAPKPHRYPQGTRGAAITCKKSQGARGKESQIVAFMLPLIGCCPTPFTCTVTIQLGPTFIP